MRRKEREITDINEIINIIKKNIVCRIALLDNDMPYILPMNFGFTYENEKICFYFHSAKEGKKVDIINNNPHAVLEIDGEHKVLSGETACSYSMNFESVIAKGKLKIIDNNDTDEKIKGLNSIMKQCTGKEGFDFAQKIDSVLILKFETEEITAKKRAK